MKTCANGIAFPSEAYCQRYDVALFYPVTPAPPKEKPARHWWIAAG